jgi:saccharopine dehydrogenase-like NADP-dependent oxidoreductase
LDDPPRRVLVVGGTGVFGSRLVAGVLRTTGLDVVVAARDAGRLAGFVARCNVAGRVTGLTLDARNVTTDALRASGAFVVVDAAGPFQEGGHGLARAAIAAGMHYVDLADARDFIAGFAALDGAARAARVVALTGASSTPALSNAALDRITAGWRRVDMVEIAIAPGNRAPRGLSVVRAILSYVGRPVRVFVDGAWGERPGWGMTMRRELPGLGRRWLGLCETADLDIVPARFSVREAAVFRAGLELAVLHLGLLAAGMAVRVGMLRSLAPLARLFRAMAALLTPFGSDRGGMLVEATGLDAAGAPVRRRWSLVAEAGHGPVVPTLPALAALRALAEGRITQPGAMPCMGVLTLEAIAAEFAGYRIAARIDAVAVPTALFATVLGEDFARLPAPLRMLHVPGHFLRASGMAQVDGAQGRLARLVASLIGLPAAAEAIPVTVRIEAGPGWERWERDFGGRRFRSLLSLSPAGGLVERFGPFTFELDVAVDDTGVRGMVVRGLRLGSMRLPRWLAPGSIATEGVDAAGRFRFDVALSLPLGLGRVVRYRGWLVPEQSK